MPLAGSPREKKHYERIRDEYPEKGKEYAARVARNIVRANTAEGRKMKGTTEHGRTWGPPYSKPLSHGGHEKKSMAYNLGCYRALEKVALPLGNLARGFLRSAAPSALTGALHGAIPGAISGAIAGGEGNRLEGAARGALGGAALGGLSGGLLGGGRTLIGGRRGVAELGRAPTARTRAVQQASRDAGLTPTESRQMRANTARGRGAQQAMAQGVSEATSSSLPTALGLGAGVLGGGAAGYAAHKEPTWQDRLKALPGQAYQGLQGLLGG